MPILTGSQMLERARRLADDTVAPYYIPDDEMFAWISEAERALASAGKLLRDVKTYGIVEDQRWLRLGTNPEIIELRTAVLSTDAGARYKLKTVGTMDGDVYEPEDDYGLTSYSSSLSATNRPQALIFGKKSGYAELSPVSNDTYSIEATVLVYPWAIENATDEPTIPERYHQAIPIGAALMAMEGSEHEHFFPRIQALSPAWQRALIKATDEGARLTRDSAPVLFNNDMWG